MLKLKELLELDKMKYGNSIKEKHKKRMKRELVYINNPIIPEPKIVIIKILLIFLFKKCSNLLYQPLMVIAYEYK